MRGRDTGLAVRSVLAFMRRIPSASAEAHDRLHDRGPRDVPSDHLWWTSAKSIGVF